MSHALLALYAVLVGLCGAFGAHRLWLCVAYARARPPVAIPDLPNTLPLVTVQLPVYNERDVVDRLARAVAALDWPADKLEIQLLDDSTDDTGSRAAAALAEAREKGIAAYAVRRAKRTGYKAGALAAGLEAARGELIAVFDADFVPDPDFLRRLVPRFADPGVGMVQARWGHLDAGASALTRAQAVLLDGHFVIEHAARHFGGRWFNFNGTAGIWRRACIADAGGWSGDTLTEDLDLSYRAQLRGWRFVYEPRHVVPAEVPGSLAAFRTQQRRWALGSIQVARKLTGAILESQAPFLVRAEALAHLWANLAWPVSLALAAVFPLVVLAHGGGAATIAPLVVAGAGSHLGFYALAAKGRWRDVPLALALGLGMAVNQSAAVVEGLAGRSEPFVRTPKQGSGSGSYRARPPAYAPVELAIAVLNAAVLVVAAARGAWDVVPFSALFAGSFGWTGLRGLREAIDGSPAPALAAVEQQIVVEH